MQEILMKILEIVIYIVLGLIFCVIGYKILARNKNYNLNEEIDKQDITLYIDLSKENSSGKDDIDYESNYDIKSIQINPNTTE